MSNAGLRPWPDPTNHEIQMLRTNCRELEAANKTQAAQIKRLQQALHKADKWGDILSDLIEDEFITEEDME